MHSSFYIFLDLWLLVTEAPWNARINNAPRRTENVNGKSTTELSGMTATEPIISRKGKKLITLFNQVCETPLMIFASD